MWLLGPNSLRLDFNFLILPFGYNENIIPFSKQTYLEANSWQM
jgi:hypothetical protein